MVETKLREKRRAPQTERGKTRGFDYRNKCPSPPHHSAGNGTTDLIRHVTLKWHITHKLITQYLPICSDLTFDFTFK